VCSSDLITPIMSMLRSLVAQERLPDVTHLHYTPDARDVIFGAELADLAATQPRYTVHVVGTRAAAAAGGARHVSAAQLDTLCPDWRTRDLYACGPQGLLEAVEGLARDAGRARHLHTERFHAPIALAPTAITAGRVRFARSAVETRSDGTLDLLRLAEDAGLNPAHGCRMGICHGCDVVLKAGCVRDLRNNTVLDEPGQTVQLCVCAAAGDAELEL